MIFGDSFLKFGFFLVACSLQSESSANALMAQAGDLSGRPETPDLRIDDPFSIFAIFQHELMRESAELSKANIFQTPE